MALNFTRFNFIRRLLSTSVNPQFLENISKISCAEHLGDLNELITSTPELAQYPPNQWEKTFKSLTSLGFKARKYTYMISQYPKLMSMPEEKIKSALKNWLNFEFGENDTMQLLERFPELLEVSNFRKVNENLNTVKSFVGQKNGFKVLLNSPSIIQDSAANLEEKCNYLRDKMKIDPVEAYKSDVFSQNIFKIKARHLFVERLGVYVVKKHAREGDEEHTVNKNPKLYKIMDTSDKRFATKVCHVTLAEYETFEELLKKELDNDEDADSDRDNTHAYYNN